MTERISKPNLALVTARQEAMEKATPALQSKLTWILDWQATEVSRSILGRWDLGYEIDEIWNDLTSNNGRVYGKAAKTTIALFMKEDPSVVNMAHKLFLAYPDRKRLIEITEMTMQDHITHLSYSHIRQLLAVKDPTRRHELMNECLEKCWTSSELGTQVQKENGGKATNNPNGRGAAVPKDAQSVIGQMLSFADDFESRNVKVWRDQRYSVPALVDRIKPIEYTDDLANKLGELALRMRQLANEAVMRAEEAERKFEQVSRVLKAGPAGLKSVGELVTEEKETAKRTKGEKPAGRRVKIS